MTRKLLFSLLLLFSFSAARAAVYYVDGARPGNGGGLSWADAKKDIQAAINAAAAGDEIWVKAGTYLPTMDPNGTVPGDARNKSFYFIGKDVKLYGGFSGTETLLSQRNAATNVTTLSGDLDGAGGTDDAYHVMVTNGRTSACVIDGFTITGGRATGGSVFGGYSQNGGGGMYNKNSSPTVSNCIFSANTAGNATGAGMFNTSSSPVVSNCTFSANNGSGMYSYQGTPSVNNCTFSTNAATTDGGGMYNDNCNATVTGCTFSANTAGNYGGGMYNYQSVPTVSGCTFSANTAAYSGGGMCNRGSDAVVTACVFLGNAATDPNTYGNGGGMYNFGFSVPEVSNCVFSANTAAQSGGGMCNDQSSATITSCVFSANTAANAGGGIRNTTTGTSASNSTINNCTFWANTVTGASGLGGGIFLHPYCGGTITNSIFYGNTTPNNANWPNRVNIFKSGPNSTLTVSYSLIGDYNAAVINEYSANNILVADPLFADVTSPAGADGVWRTADDGLRIACPSPAKNTGTGTMPATDILGNSREGAIDMGAYEVTAAGCPGVLYVDGSRADNSGSGYGWGSAKKDIQAAINAATAGAEIWVKAGTYLPTLDPNGGTSQRDKAFYITTKDVKLYGGFSGNETQLSQRNAIANVTTLSGDLDGAGGTNDAYHVVLTINRNNACVIDGFTITGGRTATTGTFSVSTPAVSISRFGGAGMFNYDSRPTISNCVFSANAAYSGGGMYNYSSGGTFTIRSSPVVSNCVFSANTADNWGGGMFNYNGSNPAVSSCVFSANTASSGGGMYTNSNSVPSITSCTFLANTASTQGGGLYYTAIGGGSITNCILYNNTGGPTFRQNIYKDGTTTGLTVSYSLVGDYLNNAATNNYTSGAGIITGNPLFINSASPAGADGVLRTADDGLRISCASPARDAGTGTTPATDILGNARVGTAIDMGAYEASAACPNILYVNGSKADNSGNGYSWASAKKDIQAAINAATAGAEIWVKAGTYLPTLDPSGGTSQRDKTFYFIGKDVKLYGGFSGNETLLSQRNAATNVTTLSGDLDGTGGTTDAYHVVITNGRTSACVIDGFTITGGRADGGTFGSYDQDRGGGMYNSGSSSPTVSNCVFSANTTNYLGGGMYNSSGSNPAVSNCVFSANTSSSSGGGMYNLSNPVVNSCIFSANTSSSSGGGMFNSGGSPQVTNCVFSANTAGAGGGAIYNTSSSPVVSNCTFSNNAAIGASSQGAGIYLGSGSGGTITNNIFYGNTTLNNAGDANRENIYKISALPTLTVSYSLVGDYDAGASNNYTSANVFAADPLFKNISNPAGADGLFRTADDGLRLQSCSPAINAGTGTTPTADISGNNRVGAMDLGAYEYGGSSVAPTLAATATTDARSSQGGSVLTFGSCGNLIATLAPSGAAPVSGSITAKVYVQSTAPSINQTPYVRRHYDISPTTNAAAATAQITLYFTQSDFDDYNAVRGTHPPLPVDATDAAGNKANVQITQEHGTSATGLPGSYSGWNGTGPKKVLIAPMSVSWNATASRWEVSFPVSGFSGFFLHSGASAPLPVRLLAFDARAVNAAVNHIEWQTAEEEWGTSFTVLRSGDGKGFSAIGAVPGRGISGNSYLLRDEKPLQGANYYRLEIQAPGKTSYSKTVLVRSEAAPIVSGVTLTPNPASDRIAISCTEERLLGREALVMDAQGRLKARLTLAEKTVLDITQWAAGVYLLRLPDGSALRLIKQ